MAATTNADHVARILRQALREYISSADSISNVSEVDYGDGNDKPCFWVEVDGESVIIECAVWPTENPALAPDIDDGYYPSREDL